MFGAKRSPICANYELQQTGNDNRDDYQLASKSNGRSFYIDDFANSEETEGKAIELFDKSKVSLMEGSSTVTNCISNNGHVMNSLKENDRMEAAIKFFEVEPAASSLLGLQWNMEDDALEIYHGASKNIPSKIFQRAVLFFIVSVFDPLGVFSHLTMQMQLLLKTLWAKQCQCSVYEIAGENKTKPFGWVKELKQLRDMILNGENFLSKLESVELHIFSEANGS